jgi:hypothetical protein
MPEKLVLDLDLATERFQKLEFLFPAKHTYKKFLPLILKQIKN